MREIKFHYIYQHGETGRFADLYYTLDEIEKGHPARDTSDRLNRYSLVARRQYTGLKDDDGTDIYEFDIVDVPLCGKVLIERILATRDPGFEDGILGKIVTNIYKNPEYFKEYDATELCLNITR